MSSSRAEALFAPLERLLEGASHPLEVRESGRVSYVGNGIVRVEGLPRVASEELVQLSGDSLGLAFTLEESETCLVLLDDAASIVTGTPAMRTGRVLDVPVGHALLGRVVDAVGRPLDGGRSLEALGRRPVEGPAPPIISRAPVTVPLHTGVKAVDALVPIGRGQRELLLGDRSTGKTALALSTILNQAHSGVVCVYCAVGQRDSAVAGVIEELRATGALAYTVVVVARSEDPAGCQFVAPYAATSIGEFFMREGRDVLVVYDDLTCHARAYRELCLLLRRPPGRDAFPGDIFYIHSRLLERATHLSREEGGGSLSALPIVVTEAEDITAYLPTNLISITDGQIVLSSTLFQRGLLPAVDVTRSVSRVGGDAQLPAYRAVTGDLRLVYAQYQELEAFSRFDTRLSPQTRKALEHGRRVREVLRQDDRELLDVSSQIAVLLAATTGLFDELPLERVADGERRIRAVLRARCEKLCHRIEAGAPLDDVMRADLLASARAALGEQDVS